MKFKPFTEVKVTASFEYDYTEMINEMLKDDPYAFNSKAEIKEYLKNQIAEDIAEDMVNNPNCNNVNIHLQ